MQEKLKNSMILQVSALKVSVMLSPFCISLQVKVGMEFLQKVNDMHNHVVWEWRMKPQKELIKLFLNKIGI